MYVTSKTQTNKVSLAIISTLSNERGKNHYGLDCEWNAFDGTHDLTRTLMVSFPQQNIVLFDFTMMDVWQQDDMPIQV